MGQKLVRMAMTSGWDEVFDVPCLQKLVWSSSRNEAAPTEANQAVLIEVCIAALIEVKLAVLIEAWMENSLDADLGCS